MDIYVIPVNTKHLFNNYTTSAQRLRLWSNIASMLYKCYVHTGISPTEDRVTLVYPAALGLPPWVSNITTVSMWLFIYRWRSLGPTAESWCQRWALVWSESCKFFSWNLTYVLIALHSAALSVISICTYYSALQRQMTVTAHFLSELFLPIALDGCIAGRFMQTITGS